MKSYSEAEVRDVLNKRIAATSQRQVANELGVSTAFLNDVVHGRRNITEALAEALGFKRVISYKRAS